MKRRDLIRVAALGALGLQGQARAQSGSVLRFVVPYAAGGVTDAMARLLGGPMGTTLGRVIVTENKPGAAGLIATRTVLSAAPGEQLLFVNEGVLTLPLLQKDAGYDPLTDLVPVATVAEINSALMVHSSVPAKNVAELIAYAKSQPKGINAANSGIGSSGHLSTVLFAQTAGINIVHVPYKGSVQTAQALLTGEVQMQLTTPTEALLSQAREGKVRVLAVSSAKRSPLMPNVPTIGETLPGFETTGWFGFVARAGTPPEVVDQYAKATAQALAIPAVREKFSAMNLMAESKGPAEFAAMLRASHAKFTKIIRDGNISVS